MLFQRFKSLSCTIMWPNGKNTNLDYAKKNYKKMKYCPQSILQKITHLNNQNEAHKLHWYNF